MSISNNFNWAPLESDPSIFNEYFQKMGLPENILFNELYTIDYKEVQPIEGEVLSVIINYERNKENPYVRDDEKFVNSENIPFYMKQTDELDYACGVIAAMHSIGNNIEKINLSENSLLKIFFENAKTLKPEKCAELLFTNNDMKKVHDSCAKMGQTNANGPQDVSNHFVSFNYVNGKIYEFDGTINSAYLIKENVSQEEFFDETLKEISSRLDSNNITESLSIIFMTKL